MGAKKQKEDFAFNLDFRNLFLMVVAVLVIYHFIYTPLNFIIGGLIRTNGSLDEVAFLLVLGDILLLIFGLIVINLIYKLLRKAKKSRRTKKR